METETKKACEIVIEWHKTQIQDYQHSLRQAKAARSRAHTDMELRSAERSVARMQAGIAMAGRLGVPIDCATDHAGVPVRCSCIRTPQRRRKARPR